MKKILLATAMTTGLLTTSAAMADGKDKRFGKHGGSHKIYKKLDLTDEQKQQIKQIYQSVHKKEGFGQRMAQRKAFMQKRQALIEAATFDKAAATTLANEKSQQKQKGFIDRLEAEHKAWQILTPEQKTKAKEMMAKRQEKMEKRMKHKMKNNKKHHD